jgi:hypothetical protein
MGGDSDVLNPGSKEIFIDGQYPQIRYGDYILISKDKDVRWFRVSDVDCRMRKISDSLSSSLKDVKGDPAGSIESPSISVPVTHLTLDELINDRKPAGQSDWSNNDARRLVLYHSLISAGRIAAEEQTVLYKGSSMKIAAPTTHPEPAPRSFLLEDVDENGIAAAGALDFVTGAFTVDPDTVWTGMLRPPVQLYGNVVAATRGETVKGEVLGIGDASQSSQTFRLKKKPLTYIPSAGSEQGAASTLQIHVNGVRWNETRTFFGQDSNAPVYIVRQNDEGESDVIFGGCARLPTGAVVVADYRFGAGLASPPAGGIHQLAKPVPGLRSIRNPVAAYGGDDGESGSSLAIYAPKSALLLGRAISIQDMEAAAASVGGVRAVSAGWHWNEQRQQAVAQIFFIGDPSLAGLITQKLKSLSDPTTPIAVDPATPVSRTLSLQIEIDSVHFEEKNVIWAAWDRLMNKEDGFLNPDRLGIGQPLFRSHIFAHLLGVPGALAIRSLLLDGSPFPDYGVTPGRDCYFDFGNGRLRLNGESLV